MAQFVQPMALWLVSAGALAVISGGPVLGAAIAGVIVLNATFASYREQPAEHPVEALAAHLPARARVLRDGLRQEFEAVDLVPGDVLVVGPGDRVGAAAHPITGSVEVDPSSLTSESRPALRTAGPGDPTVALIQAA